LRKDDCPTSSVEKLSRQWRDGPATLSDNSLFRVANVLGSHPSGEKIPESVTLMMQRVEGMEGPKETSMALNKAS
jgi:hypothetical protein